MHSVPLEATSGSSVIVTQQFFIKIILCQLDKFYHKSYKRKQFYLRDSASFMRLWEGTT